MSLLEVEDVRVHYGEVKAVEDVSFAVEPGSIFGIIGPNGAGKSSLVDGLSGFAPLAGGTVRLAGREIGATAPHLRVRRGLARTWQAGELFEDLTVLENVLAAADSPPWWTLPLDALHPGRRVRREAELRQLVDRLGLGHVAERQVDEIPQDLRKLTSIARALAGDPSVVLMDEPAAGLTPDETAELGRRLRETAATGIAIVLIDHDMELVLSVCERLLVLDFGKPIAEGEPQQVIEDPSVVAAYLGSGAAVVAEVDTEPAS
ncbi:MAG TPA: ABC transporter ATP-binding protein [Solirubrobacterales bacterium]|jgi:ABC-type branched-subunit amino acid transport system ATPase component